jgi:hypothetical protein
MKAWHRYGVALSAVLFAPGATAIVQRDDVPESAYRATAAQLPALVDLPNEGHGLLVAPNWVLTVAHAAAPGQVPSVTIQGRSVAVAEVIRHPGFRAPDPGALTGDTAVLMKQLAASADIALIRLAEPVAGIAPLPLYRGTQETGKGVWLYGKGATATGRTGVDPKAPHRSELRRATNQVERVDGAWLVLRFDAPPAGTAREGLQGNGDSGGPVLINHGGQWQLAGLMSWQRWNGRLEDYRASRYGAEGYQVRVSHYLEWIDATMAGRAAE